MSDNSREKKEFEEKVNWGMCQAFIPHMKTPKSDGQRQVYLYGRNKEEMLENTVTFLPPALQEVVNHHQQQIQLHYAASPYYFDSKPPNLFHDGVIMTLVSMEITPWLTVSHLDSLSHGVSMGKFVNYILACSFEDESFKYDIYSSDDLAFSEPIVCRYFGDYDGYRPVLIGLAATPLVHEYSLHDELMGYSSESFISEYDEIIWNGQETRMKPYKFFTNPTQEARGRISGPNHQFDC
jgi:hypothetical protein